MDPLLGFWDPPRDLGPSLGFWDPPRVLGPSPGFGGNQKGQEEGRTFLISKTKDIVNFVK